MLATLLPRRQDVRSALFALVAWLGVAVVLPAVHAWEEARHGDHAEHAAGFDPACPADCRDADHHHGHDHATCPACRVHQLAAAPAERGPRVERVAVERQRFARFTCAARDASVVASRPRGPPAPSFAA